MLNLSSFLDDRLIVVSINHAITITVLLFVMPLLELEMCTTYE